MNKPFKTKATTKDIPKFKDQHRAVRPLYAYIEKGADGNDDIDKIIIAANRLNEIFKGD